MKCSKCKMEIPSGASICPYCRSKQDFSFGFLGDAYDTFKKTDEAFQNAAMKRMANNPNGGCMVILPLILIAASSICFLISTYI